MSNCSIITVLHYPVLPVALAEADVKKVSVSKDELRHVYKRQSWGLDIP